MTIASVQITTALVEISRSATSYFHRLLNEIIDTLNGQSGQASTATVSPDGSGLATILHGYSVTGHPASIGQSSVQPTGSTAFHVQIVSVTGTELTVKLFDMAGAAITSGSYSIAWKVAG